MPVTSVPSVTLYIRITQPDGRRRYERFNRRKPQLQGGVYCLHYFEQGRRKWQTVGTDINAALAARFAKETALLREPVPAAPIPERYTLAQRREQFIEQKQLSRKQDGTPLDKETLTAYEQQTAEFLRAAQSQYPEDVTGMDLRRYMAALERRGLTHRSICNNYTSIGTFLLFCGVDHKKLLPRGERPRPDDGVPESYTLAEVQQFLFCVERERNRLFFEFLLKTGAREREATTLEWGDLTLGAQPTVSFAAKKPHLKFRNKTGKSRVVPLEQGLAAKLQDWREKNPTTKLVFGTGSDREDNHYLDVCKETAVNAGVKREDWYLHKWRHTFCTWALRRGVDIRTCQAWMGHTSITMTERYLSPATDRLAQDNVNAAFGSVNLEGAAHVSTSEDRADQLTSVPRDLFFYGQFYGFRR